MKRAGFFVAAAAVVLLGCSTQQLVCGIGTDTRCEPIRNVVHAPIVVAAGEELSMTRISEAIRLAGAARGWRMHHLAPGSLHGRLELRSHVAEVDVEHDNKTYSITYRDSSNLSAGSGMIHRSYNDWVRNLNDSIRTQLAQR